MSMLADSAIFHKSPAQVLLFGGVNLAVILAVAWFGTRSRRQDFKFGRVIGLTLLCLAASLPFAWFAFLWWPWDFQSWIVRLDIFLMIFAPLVPVFALVAMRKRKALRK